MRGDPLGAVGFEINVRTPDQGLGRFFIYAPRRRVLEHFSEIGLEPEKHDPEVLELLLSLGQIQSHGLD